MAGILITIAAMRPPDFLQKLIVFGAGGLAASFLFPTLLGIYWKGMTRLGALSAMIGGFLTTTGLFVPTMLGSPPVAIFGLDPNFWGLIVSLILAVTVSKLTGPPPKHLIRRYFFS